MPEVAENGTYALLTARHIDDLTEAIRAQTTNQAIANEPCVRRPAPSRR